MGERYQSHLLFELENSEHNKEEIRISVHMQWCWGMHIIRNMDRVLKTLNKSRLEYVDQEVLKNYISAIFSLNKSFSGEFYPYNVHVENGYKTSCGDSNHGWNVVRVKVNKDGNTSITSRFYDYEGKEVTREKLLSDAMEEFEGKEGTDEIKKVIDKLKKMSGCKLFNNTDEDLQKIFNDGVKK